MKERQDFIFIVGAPRSGTYLLSALLNSHLSISIPVETHFIPLFGKVLFLWGDLSKFKNRKRILKCIYSFLEIWTPRSEKGRNFEKIKRYSLLITKNKQEKILKESASYSDLVNNLFSEYSSIYETCKWGDKSAFFRHVDLNKLNDAVKNPKIIHIIRDGRDVCVSWMKTWFGPLFVSQSALLWKEHIEKKREWGKKNTEKYLEIKYENLIESPNDTLKKITNFLQISTPVNVKKIELNTEFAKILASGGSHPLLTKPLGKKYTEKWRSEMPKKNIIVFEYVAGHVLESCGYPIEKNNINNLHQFLLKIKVVVSCFVGFFSIRSLYMKLKSILPIGLFLCSLIEFPLEKFLNRKF